MYKYALRHLQSVLAVLSLSLCCLGCTTWHPDRVAGDGGADPIWQSELREPSQPGQRFGLDSRSKDIERNLGIR